MDLLTNRDADRRDFASWLRSQVTCQLRRLGTPEASRRSKSVVTRLPVPLVLLVSLMAACGTGRDDRAVDAEPGSGKVDELQASVTEAVVPVELGESQPTAEIPEFRATESQTSTPHFSDAGPYQVGGDIERPRHLGARPPIEGLIAMMRSGDYAWGACIFRVTIAESGEVGEVEFLKPEDLAAEVQEVIAEAVQEWRFSPATRAGEPVAVYYTLVIHHCPYHRIDRDTG